MQVVLVSEDALRTDEVVNEDLEQAAVASLCVRVHHLLQLVEFVGKGFDLVGDLKDLQFVAVHNLLAHLLVLEVERIHRLLNDVRGEGAELGLHV